MIPLRQPLQALHVALPNGVDLLPDELIEIVGQEVNVKEIYHYYWDNDEKKKYKYDIKGLWI